MQLQFEAAMSDGLGDAFTRKYIGSLTLTLGHTKCCSVPSTSCGLFRCNVKVATSNGFGGNTFTRNVTDGQAHTWTDRQTGRLRYEINILVFLKKKKRVYYYALCVTATVIEDPDEMSAGMSVLKHAILLHIKIHHSNIEN